MANSVVRSSAMSTAPGSAYRALAAVVLVAAAAGWSYFLVRSMSKPLRFDDAYMFYRYATHIREGLGMSWNLDAVHTYGETSLLWGFAVLVLSYLPMSMSNTLIFGSWLCSVGALIVLAWAVARNAKSANLSRTWFVLPMVAIPFEMTYIFRANTVTGMETMMATLFCALFVGLVLGWAAGTVRPELAGLMGLLLFLVRPEAALVVGMMPVLACLLLRGEDGKGATSKRTAALLGVFLAGFALDLVFCKLYFGEALPLSFYMKTQHGYEGYHTSWGPTTQTVMMLLGCWIYFALLAVCARRTDLRRTLVCLLPAAAAFAYMCTVTQIMGYDSRYYITYLPLIAVPALLAMDARLAETDAGATPYSWKRRAAVVLGFAVVALALARMVKHPVLKLKVIAKNLDHRLEHRDTAYDPVHFEVRATTPLEQRYWFMQLTEIADVLLKPLPKGATIAASEVGLLGGAAPEVNVIDLAGLNDPTIALHGFDMGELLSRKPDIIWMPHSDYTYQRGIMMSDPRLLQQYDMYVGALGYGLALRKDSPIRPAIDRQVKILWNDLYSGYQMDDYLARSTTWTRSKHKVTGNDEVDRKDETDQLERFAASVGSAGEAAR